MSVAFLFPGQGVQYEGMLGALPRHPAIVATMAEACATLGVQEGELDNAAALASTEGVQLALLVAGVATARALAAEAIHADFVAGMSVGAFGAAVFAGAVDFPSALKLVQARGRLMAAAYPTGYGMAAILGLDENTVRRLADGIRSPSVPVYLANVNARDQLVIAGSDRGLEKTMDAARARGARRTQRLAVPIPSHCPLMDAAAVELSFLMAQVPMTPVTVAYLTNRHARAVTSAEEIRADLAGNLCAEVRWHDMTTAAFERGARVFVEMAPGAALSELVRASLPDVRAVSFQAQDLPELVQSIRGKAG